MHELSIVDALIEQVRNEVERAGHSGRITRLEVAIGRLSGVNVESFRFGFQILSPGTLVEAAELVIAEPRALCRCHACGTPTQIDELTAVCPVCGSGDVSTEGGQDLLLQSIELEDGS